MASLERFVEAQEACYARVREELAAGRKRSHWMWFVFPQIAGLGRSAMARRFALGGPHEAGLYLMHPLLASRLEECTELMLGWSGKRSAEEMLGALDALKLRSSMTLFTRAAAPPSRARDACRQVLLAFFAGRPDEATLELLAAHDVNPAGPV